jgi:hypothetical protein
VFWSLIKTRNLVSKTVSDEDWRERGFIGKFLYFAVEYPFNFLRFLSIPPCEEENWSRLYGSVWFPFGVLFICWTNSIDFHKYWIEIVSVVGASIVVGGVVFCTTYVNRPPNKCFMLLYAFFAFIMAVAWINWVANILVDLL